MTENKTDIVTGQTELTATSEKPGIKTTEMWVAIIGLILPAALAAMQKNAPVQAGLVLAALILPAIYIWGRCVLKAEQIKATNIIPDEWEPVIADGLTITEAVDKAVKKAIADKPAATGDPDATAE